MLPGAASREGVERGCGNILRLEIYENSVGSVEAGMTMEEQIMCVERCTF